MKPSLLFNRAALLSTLVLIFGIASLQAQNASPVEISEFLASNTHGLRDDDGDTSDWIELHNISSVPVNLEGWFLTDSRDLLTRWRLPATNIIADARLIIFASGKNRTRPGLPLATQFRLNSKGGYLALVKPDGATIASDFRYGEQFPDVSFGQGLGPSLHTEPIVGPSPSMRYLLPSSPVPDAWRGGALFDDTSWQQGTLEAGFDRHIGDPVVAYTAPTNTPGNQAFSGSLGLDFDVVRPVELLELGCFDDNGDGIAAGVTVTVQLYRRNNGGTPGLPTDDRSLGLVFTTNFTQSSSGALKDAFRFKPLPNPLQLTNGSYTIVASGYGAKERLANLVEGVSVVSGNSGDGALHFTGLGRYSDSAKVFPTSLDANALQYAAGTFTFRTVPDTHFGTHLDAMDGTSSTVFVRVPFSLPPGKTYSTLRLDVRYDDGFVAWVNGVEVARRNAPSSLGIQSTAVSVASGREVFDLSGLVGVLHPGENILAVQGLNYAATDDDFRLNVGLEGEVSGPGRFYFAIPSPGENNTAGLLYPRVLINEIHSDPLNSKTVPLEFVEIYNPLPESVDVSGWSLSRGVTYRFPARTEIPARGYLVVADSPSSIAARFGVVALGPWEGSLSNDGETLELTDGSGAVVESVSYGLAFPWPMVGQNDFSMQLINEGLDRNLGNSWRSGSPTPGRRNSVSAPTAPPAVRQVTHLPSMPPSNVPVVISARVTDPEGVAAVQLEYQVVESGNYIRMSDVAFTNQWTLLPMTDNGQGGDQVANDDVYSVQIPPSVQVNRRLVRYRIKVEDRLGASVKVPYDDDTQPNFAYFVYDGVPAWKGAVQPGVTPPTTFSEETMRRVRAWHLISRSNDVYNCQYNSAFNDGIYRFEGALVVGEKVYDHVHYRVKGQNSTYNTGKNKWKIKFNRGHWLEMPDDYDTTSTTVEIMNVSSLPSSWAPWNRGMAGLDEVIQYRLSNLAGVPAPRTTYFQLRVIDSSVEQPSNTQYDGDLWGLYIGFENQDNRFKDAHGLPDGNIFRMQAANNHLLGQGAGQPTNLRDLNAFLSTTTGYNRSPSQPESWWRTNVDLQRYYSWRAVDEAVNNTDIRDQENVVYFRDPTNGKWHVEPWDCDLLYEQLDRWGPQATQSNVDYEQIRRCLIQTNLLVEFKNRARELQDLLLNSDQTWKLVDEYLSLITDGGPDNPGFVEVDRRRWDYNPINPVPPRGLEAFGNYYKSPYPIPDMGQGPPQPFYRVLTTPDFAGLVTWVKNFIAFDPHGGARLAQLASDATIPTTPKLTYLGSASYPADELTFSASGFESTSSRKFAAMEWRLGEVSDPSVPGFQPGKPWHYEIEPLWTSGILSNAVYQITLPAEVVREGRTYRARVRYQDDGLRWSHWSDPIQFTVSTPGIAELSSSLIVSELMYHPRPATGISSDAFEFIELRNIGTHTLRLGGLSFTAGISFTFPAGTTLPPAGTFLLVRDAGAFASRYPGVSVQGVYTGRLDDGGETITLSHPSGGTVFSFRYHDVSPWPAVADGHGFSIVPVDDRNSFDPSNPLSWRASSRIDGSPGAVDLPPDWPTIYINELAAHSSLDGNFIEFYNQGTSPVNVSGWFLTDDPGSPSKYPIKVGSVIDPNGFLVIPESEFGTPFGSPKRFSLRPAGGSVYLFGTKADGSLTGYSHGVDYGGSFEGDSFGRVVLSQGDEQMVLQSSPSRGSSNQPPRLGPLVMTEIDYHPVGDNAEFVEIGNLSTDSIALFNPETPSVGWRLKGWDFVFPTNLIVKPNEQILVTSTDPSQFRARYSIPETVRIFGPAIGKLQDGGEHLELQRPERVAGEGIIYITVDELRYSSLPPWPSAPDGGGASLQRLLPPGLGNDVYSWRGLAPSPGDTSGSGVAPVIVEDPVDQRVLSGGTASFSVAAVGSGPLEYQWTHNGAAILNANASNLVLRSVSALDAGRYGVVVFNPAGSVISKEATLSLLPRLVLLVQPTNNFIRPGVTARFSVSAVGTGALSYQWRKDGADIPGATQSSLTVPSTGISDNGVYTCQVADDFGKVVSAPAQLLLLVDPLIVQAPVGQEMVAGGTLVLSITVTNTATLPIGYRLRRNGGSVPGGFFVSSERTAFFVLSGTNAAPPWTNFVIAVTNLAKSAGFTSPTAVIRYVADSDKDGLPDAWETQFFGLPGAANPAADTDGDGMLNGDEYLAGTDPLDPLSYLKLRTDQVRTDLQISFDAVSNRTYRVEFADTLELGAWQTLSKLSARSTNRVELIIDSLSNESRYYRLKTPAAP